LVCALRPTILRATRESFDWLSAIPKFAVVLLTLSFLPATVLLPQLAAQQAMQNGSAAKIQTLAISGCGDQPYCADSSRQLRPSTPTTAPRVNQVFRDPDFGSRIVRVTDESGIDGKLRGLSFNSNSSAEINEWGKFDPSLGSHGGYYFYVNTGGGGAVVFSMDAATMQVTPHCDAPPLCRIPGGSFSYVDPHILYGHFGENNLITSYDVSNGKQFTLYDLKKCPNIPDVLSGYAGAVSNSGDDSKFSGYSGGRGQDGGSLVTYYDRTSGHCYWYDTGSGTLGGSGMTTVETKVGVLAPSHAVSLRSVSGSLPPGDYYVEVTVDIHRPSGAGETLASPEAHIRLDSIGGIEVSPPQINNLYGMFPIGYNVYIGSSPGQEMRQALVNEVESAYTQSAPLAKGIKPPTVSSAGYNVHNARLSRDGTAIKIIPKGARSLFIWMPGTTNISACSLAGEGHDGVASYCGGHTVLGYSHMINPGGPGGDESVLIRPLSQLDNFVQRLTPEVTVPKSMDVHWSWNNDQPSDTTPVCGAYSGAAHREGDGTRNPATNPLLSERQPWDREIVCVATSGPPKVWRFANHHATTACNASAKSGSCFEAIAIGNVSQDGRFFLFSSDWDWGLGSDSRHPGCPTSGRCRVDAFVVELK
jgi:hypothetical protein